MEDINLRKSISAILCAFVLLGVSSASFAEWVGNASVSMRHDSNVSNAEMVSDITGVTSLSVDVSATNFFALEEGKSLSITGTLGSETFDRYSGLNNVSVGAIFSARKKWSLGIYAPWTGVSLSTSRLDFANNIRNMWRHQLALRGGKRIAERWSIGGGLMAEQRDARPLAPDIPELSGDVFSQSSRTLTFNSEYIWSDRAFVTLGALLRHGDITATATESPKIIAASTAAADDPVLSSGPHSYAYRLRGTTQGLNVDMTFTLSNHSALNVSIARYLSYAKGDIYYARNIQSLFWNHDF